MPGTRLAPRALRVSGYVWGCWGSPSLQPNDDVLQVQVHEPLQRGCVVTCIQGWLPPGTGDPKAESALQQQGLYAFPKLTFNSFCLPDSTERSHYSNYYY